MNDLISKSALLAEMELDEPDSIDENNREIKAMRREWNHWKKKIKHFPTVDAVEVVRCKECKHFSPCEEITGATWTGYCNYGEFHTDEEDFCSRGERKENGSNS